MVLDPGKLQKASEYAERNPQVNPYITTTTTTRSDFDSQGKTEVVSVWTFPLRWERGWWWWRVPGVGVITTTQLPDPPPLIYMLLTFGHTFL